MFLGERRPASADGSKVEPVLASGSGAAHDEFLKDVVGKSAPALKNHLKTLVFTGKGSMPKSFASEAGHRQVRREDARRDRVRQRRRPTRRRKEGRTEVAGGWVHVTLALRERDVAR